MQGTSMRALDEAEGGRTSLVSVEFPASGLMTVALLDGRKRRGKVARFSVNAPDIMLEPETDPNNESDKRKAIRLRAEDVAYIGAHRSPELQAQRTIETQLEPYKIHVAGGERIAVRTSRDVTHAVGFLAYPTDAENPFHVIFFYSHGVNAREKDAPLGALLISAGVLNRGALEQGINAQSAARSVPIGQILIEQKRLDKETIDEAVELQKRKRLRIGDVLKEAGLVSEQDIEHALAEQKKRRGKRLGEMLVDLGILKERDLSATLAHKFDLPFVNLDEVAINVDALALVGRELVAKYGVVPLDMDVKTLTIAISDPTSMDAIDVLRVHTGRRVREVLVMPSQLKMHVEICLERLTQAQVQAQAQPQKPAMTLDAIIQGIKGEARGMELDEEEEVITPKETEAGVSQLVNQIVLDGYRQGASDIHIEPNGKSRNVTVRFRIDGDCKTYQELPPIVRNSLVSCIKIMAKLDISERRKPQDGKIRFKLAEQPIELRVATIPSVNNNEDVVLRILAASKPMPLDRIGLSSRNLQGLNKVLAQPYGLMLCVGPTGSGKTTTLHSALGHLNRVDMKIWTAEDPVEITQPGLRQVQVQPKIGFTFAAAMRAFLRADPDVIMVGEMRDHETASTAVEASLTGHLVLSTLHTNSAPETITRMLDMGLDPFTFADALLGVLAQRLARALCKQCRVQERGTMQEYDELIEAYGEDLFAQDIGASFSDFTVYRSRGCQACGDSGYKGRLGIHELLVSDDAMKLAISKKASVETIRVAAIERGMRTLMHDGIQKVIAGQTDLKQVLAVCTKR
jgi:type II secretory ATPase GspE/PulE/Tfp pilus assembly ATPase PilB-like protein